MSWKEQAHLYAERKLQLFPLLKEKQEDPGQDHLFRHNAGLTVTRQISITWKLSATFAVIISRGSRWFRETGTDKSPGTKVFSLVGKVKNTGLVEMELGSPINNYCL